MVRRIPPRDSRPDWDAQYAYHNECRGAVEGDRTRPEGTWRILPFAGAELVHLSVAGPPKDAQIRAQFSDGRMFEADVSDGRAYVSTVGGMAVETLTGGDTVQIVRYRPLPGHRLVVVEAGVDYPGDGDANWDDDLAAYLEPSALGVTAGGWAVLSARFDLRSEPLARVKR